jgi:hypothetical protein
MLRDRGLLEEEDAEEIVILRALRP